MDPRLQENEAEISLQQGAYLVYVAGVHVPCSAVTVAFSINTFPTASIQLPADNTLKALGREDRVPVVIFYLDKWYGQSDTIQSKKVTPTWRLLFDGDITQLNYSRSPANRVMGFSAISHNSVLNIMSIIYLTGKAREALEAASQGKVESQQAGTYAAVQVLQFFNKGAYGTGDIERPIDFVKNLLTGMAIGGPPQPGVYLGVKNLQDELVSSNQTSSAVNGETFQDLRLPFAKETSASSEFFIKYNYRNKLDKRWIASSIELAEGLGLPGSGSQTSKAGETDGETETDKQKSPQEPNKKKTIPDESFIALMKRLAFDNIRTNFTQRRSMQDTFWNLIQSFYTYAMYQVIQIPTAQYVNVGIETDIPNSSSSGEARLANCLSVPDMTWALPPSCNVFTPAMVSDFNFSEDYLSQNTRTIVDGSFSDVISDYGNNPLFALRFAFPADQNQLFEKSNTTKRSPENILIYPEEYFKGPVVTRPKAPAFFLSIEQNSRFIRKEYKTKVKDGAKNIANGKGAVAITKLDEAAKVSIKKWRQELLYNFAKSYYLQNKYSARNGSISLAFTPYVIPGMSFAMIDLDDFDQFHLTGVVTSVTISMSNASANTSISYSAGRTLSEVYEEVFAENTFGPDRGVLDQAQIASSDLNDIYSTAPIYPINALAKNLQVDANAQSFYQNLLFFGDSGNIHSYAFKFTDYFKSSNGNDIAANNPGLNDTVKQKLTGSATGSSAGRVYPGTITNVSADSSNTITKFNLDLRIKDEERQKINDYDLSMRRSSRPICSLEDYVKMMNTPAQQAEISKRTETYEEFGVEYPVQIRVYTISDELGDNYIRPYAKINGLTNPSAELRRDWVSKLEEYRSRVKNNSILGR